MIPTAKELFNKMLEENDECMSTEMMIEFAKMHVEEALKQASEKVIVNMKDGMDYYYEDYIEGIDKASILNAYSLENVK